MKNLFSRWYKLQFVLSHIPYYGLPNGLRRYDAESVMDSLTSEQMEYVLKRVRMCNKVVGEFSLSSDSKCLNDLKLNKYSAYKLDFAKASLGFKRECRFDMVFGDVVDVPGTPSLVKTRPIVGGNENSVLLKLNTPRHFRFYKDPYSYAEKSNVPIFRGYAHTEDRKKFLRLYEGNPGVDFTDSHRKGTGKRVYLGPVQQMAHKFILSIEGNDVASNLKWIMASNSICVMKRPTIESWFLESQLKPGVHYVEIDENFSNVEEVIQPYLDDEDMARAMVRAQHEYLAPFLDADLERLIMHLVLENYLRLAGC
ncbi:MAG: glycosyl transferase family 90 [Akkermansiaceae bacterium]